MAEDVGSSQEDRVGAHEVGVAANTRLRVEPRENLSEELDLRGIVTGGLELGDPNLLDVVLVGEFDGLVDELLEVVGEGRIGVPVDSKSADLAVSALAEEALHPVQSLTGGARVANSRADEGGIAGVGGHVLLVVGGSLGRRHVGLAGDVGLVEAQQVLAARGKGRVGSGRPATVHLGAPEHGDVLHAGGKGTIGLHVPVVGPGDTSQCSDEGGLVVSSTLLGGSSVTLGVEVLMRLVRSSQSNGSHEAGHEKSAERNHLDDLVKLLLRYVLV